MSKQEKDHMPDIQLFCNLVIRRQEKDGQSSVLLIKTDPDDDRWWLPWADLEPYQHPDDAVRWQLQKFAGLSVSRMNMAQVESFRGRAGWHVTFDYLVDARGEPAGEHNSGWFPPEKLPRTAHGEWEMSVVRKVIAAAPTS
jgi:ADP-ribose pyrophosphatase YjhB (NUDIX family)